ncbi:MAG: DHH family phosphoesterase [Bacteroidales bacterium]|nr:DHH family phosphoesterase [Bacteroidales bacterium]
MLQKSAKTVIVTHMKPDGDAAGSTTAMYHFIRQHNGADVKIVLNDGFQRALEFLLDENCRKDICIYSEDPESAAGYIAGADTIICLDFNAFHRTDRLCSLLEESPAQKVLIDHHLYPELNRFSLAFSETGISSACELLYYILMAMPQTGQDARRLPKAAATSLMTGMTTDTNNFANSVYPSTLAMASSLLDAGVDRDYILSCLYNQHSESRLRLMGHMMKDLLTITEDGAAYMILDLETQKKYNVQEGDTEGFVNMPLSIAGVRMSLMLKEDSDRIRVSIRSKKGTSANTCARMFFNGGGHENAAGGKLNMPIQKVEEYIKEHVHIYLTEHEDKVS